MVSDSIFLASKKTGLGSAEEMRRDQGGGAIGAISQFYICNVKHIDSYASPSLFIIDENGRVRYQFISKEAEVDYPKDDELLSRIRGLSARNS